MHLRAIVVQEEYREFHFHTLNQEYRNQSLGGLYFLDSNVTIQTKIRRSVAIFKVFGMVFATLILILGG